MSKFKKIVFSVVVVVFLFVSMCPTFAFAAAPLLFDVAEPFVSNTTGYMAVLGERVDLNNDRRGYIVFYSIAPVTSGEGAVNGDTCIFKINSINHNVIKYSIVGDPNTTYNFTYGVIHQDGTCQNIATFTFTGDYSNHSITFHSQLKVVAIDCHGYFNNTALGSSFPTFEYLFTPNKYEYLQLSSIFQALVGLGDLTIEEVELLESIVSNSSDIESAIKDIKTVFSEKLDTIISDNAYFKERLIEMINYLHSIDAHSVDILEWLSVIYTDFCDIYFLLEEDLLLILDAVDDLEGYTDEVEDLLRQIVDLLNSSGSSDLTAPDTSQLDNYYEIEQGLINRSDVDVSNAVNVQIDQNAMAVTWNLIDSILNSNGKVFGLFLTVLSLGIIALILGR